MFAVIKTGGKQYRVAQGGVIRVEKLDGAVGDVLALGGVLALGEGAKVTLEKGALGKAKVAAEIVAQGKGDKVIVFKKKRRHNYRRKNGHRQYVTTLKILEIAADGNVTAKASSPKAAQSKPEEKKAKPAAKKAPAKGAAAKKKDKDQE